MRIKWDRAALFHDEDVWEGVKDLAGRISYRANQATSAEVGITYNDVGSGESRRILIGPRGAAAIPVEFGTSKVPAKRYFKRTIDGMRE